MNSHKCKGLCLVILSSLGWLPLDATTQACPAERDHWQTSLDVGEAVSQAQQRKLFILFTGTEWCSPCVDFERLVLTEPTLEILAKNYVLVRLNFPHSDDDIPREIKDRMVRWRDRFGVRIFPLVILVDENGRPYGLSRHTGHDAAEFLRRIELIESLRERTDTAFVRAKLATGEARTSHLDEAFSNLDEALSRSNSGMQVKIISTFYKDELLELVKCDKSHRSNFLARYNALLQTESEDSAIAEMKARFSAASKHDGPGAALKIIDEELGRTSLPGLKKRLQRIRLTFLEDDNRFEHAAAYADEISKSILYSSDEKRYILGRYAYNLIKAGQIDLAIKVYDKLIIEYSDDRYAAWELCRNKAQMLETSGKLDAALDAWACSRLFADPGSGPWLETEFFHARLLGRLGRGDEAIAGIDLALSAASLSPYDRARLLSEKSLILVKMGRFVEAVATADKSESLLDPPQRDATDPVAGSIRDTLNLVRKISSTEGGW